MMTKISIPIIYNVLIYNQKNKNNDDNKKRQYRTVVGIMINHIKSSHMISSIISITIIKNNKKR